MHISDLVLSFVVILLLRPNCKSFQNVGKNTVRNKVFKIIYLITNNYDKIFISLLIIMTVSEINMRFCWLSMIMSKLCIWHTCLNVPVVWDCPRILVYNYHRGIPNINISCKILLKLPNIIYSLKNE
jgi:hypothetical protein